MIIAPEHEHLIEDALWLIMDPWVKSPAHDLLLYPYLDAVNHLHAKKIEHYLMDIPENHVVYAVDGEPMPYFKKYKNMESCRHVNGHMMKYIDTKNIVYCGFHHGRCIRTSDAGIINMVSFGYICYVKHDLTAIFPGDINNMRGIDDRTSAVATMI